jgi:lipopolysaccharide transport system ATP-binding protein
MQRWREPGESEMSDIAIRAANLSKRYDIVPMKERHNTLRDELVHRFRAMLPGNRTRRTSNSDRGVLWAIKDVSFDVARGEVVGIVGKNGAGKSTLLKVLSRITEPSRGRCEIYGRMVSLLEVGTGFHGELTGRENVFLNGAILGMKKAEIERKFDEIVAFAEVAAMIDTPVKRYSSGMYVRLAFAVAAHLEPEIFVVDEVLAVGDMSFQNKCIGKMSDVAREGRTVLFVSHNMGAVTNLCTTGMWLDQGRVKMRGDIKSVVDAYVKGESGSGPRNPAGRRRMGTGDAKVLRARLLDSEGHECAAFMMGDTITLECDVEFRSRVRSANFTIDIRRKDIGMSVLSLQSDDSGFSVHHPQKGVRRFTAKIPNCMLYPTSYEMLICIWDIGTTFDYVDGIVEFSMIQSGVTRRTSSLMDHREAIYYSPSVWSDVPVS